MSEIKEYWDNRYKKSETGWDLGEISQPIKSYINQLVNKEISILIPGAGNGHEAAYLHKQGFKNVTMLDISAHPLEAFKLKNPTFPSNNLIQQDFFKHKANYDLIIEQTFFCTFPPEKMNRVKYATKMASLLKPNGKLVGVFFNFPLVKNTENPPYGGSLKEYRQYFQPYFKLHTFEVCYNSEVDRQDKELFAILHKKAAIKKQANNPLHGITLKTMLEELILHEGWENMANACRINCFYENPTLKSSLTFLRKTPWAREKVERYYLRVKK